MIVCTALSQKILTIVHFQLHHQFTDVAGSLSHGIAITVREEFTHSDASKISSVIELQRERRKAAVIIARWYRVHFHRPKRAGLDRLNSSSRSIRRSHSTAGNSLGLSFSRKGSAEDQKSGRNSGMRFNLDKMYRSRFKSASMSDLAFDDSDTSENPNEVDSIDNDDECDISVSEQARRMGIAAYQAMIDSDKEGDMCIVEKCYIIMGTRLADQSVVFYALQNLIDMERKVSVSSFKCPVLLADPVFV